MIQGGGVSTDNKDAARSSSNPIERNSLATPDQAQVAHSQITATQRQRVTLTQNVSTVIATAPVTAVGGSNGNNTSFQHYLIPGVSLGGQLQNISIPAQVTVSVQQTGVSTVGVDSALPNPTYTISSPQSLARILAAASQSYSVRAGTVSQNSVSNINTSGQLLPQTLENSTVALNVQNLQLSKTTCSTVLTLPVTTTTMSQRTATSSGRQDALSLRLSPSVATSSGQPTLILESSSAAVQPGDVTRVHSYSLASASSTADPSSCNLTQMGSLSPNKVVVPAQKVLSVSSHNVQPNSPLKRTVNAFSACSVTSVHSFGSCVTSNVSPANDLSFSTANTVFVTTSNPLISCSGSSIPSTFSTPKPKRTRLEEKPAPNEEIAIKRRRICDYECNELNLTREHYWEDLVEFFFLQGGGNMMDFLAFQKKPVPQLASFFKANVLDSEDEEEYKFLLEKKFPTPALLSAGTVSASDAGNVISTKQTKLGIKPSVCNSSSSHSLSQSQYLSSSQTTASSPKPPAFSPITTQAASQMSSDKTPRQHAASPLQKSPKHHSISAVYDSSIGSQEEIVERAKQEAYAMQRISELRKEGLWSMKRLPKVQEPPRAKAHWDYLLEEMVWLATDFAQERKWKKAAAKKCARMVLKYHQEKEMKAEKAEREEQQKLRKIASVVSKEIKQFWANIEKLVEYKQNTILEEKRKKFLDLHLNYIVDQTEKYSSWLTQGLNRSFRGSAETSRASSPVHDSHLSSPSRNKFLPSDKEFLHGGTSGSDDEETIEKEDNMSEGEQCEEVRKLQEGGQMPLEKLVFLPPEAVTKRCDIVEQNRANLETEDKEKTSYFDKTFTKEDVMLGRVDVLADSSLDDDEEFQATSDDDEDDDEATILEQENVEKGIDYAQEIRDLENENELSVEDLILKYADAYNSDFEVPGSEESSEEADDDEEEECKMSHMVKREKDSSSEDENHVDETDEKMDVSDVTKSTNVEDGYSTAVCSNIGEKEISKGKNPSKEITDIAATAESFQPKGNTLSTTQVYTKVPFLLKHPLREYQHIGLDWLYAMNDKKLNGILADEMGLGKTIQTISLLAYLACEKGMWGPHLIVVPTSVMLNWEMEFKKWCPGFKILTYYGTPKERKQKRMGWTKPNAFHVCITSYKLVIQDHHSFRRKKWKYFILDEAQHIKNFRSQRWQMLLNFQSSHRLLLTGTPLQNSLVELWSLMHFLMPNIFQSHKEFKEWFVNPVTGMIEGNMEYNESLIKRLHKVLRPFLLRRLKCEVEKQLPKKYEHIIMCRLSKRQRYLYDDFMSQSKTKETLATGSFMSVINILMQLRKVCNHPNMFEVRAIVSPFMMEDIIFYTSSLVCGAVDYDPFKHVNLWGLNMLVADLELSLTAFAAHRIKKFAAPPRLIEEIDNLPDPPPRCPPGRIRLHVQNSQAQNPNVSHGPTLPKTQSPALARMPAASVVPRMAVTPPNLTSPQRYVVVSGHQSAPSSRATSPVAAVAGHQIIGQPPAEYTLQLLQQSAGSLPVAQLAPLGSQVVTSTPITVQIQQTVQGGARLSMPLGIGRLVQTSTGQHLLLTPAVSTVSTEPQQITSSAPSTVAYTCVTNSPANLSPIVMPGPTVGTATVLPQVQKIGTSGSIIPPFVTALNRSQVTTSVSTSMTPQIPSNKPIGRVAPLNIHPPTNAYNAGNSVQNVIQERKLPVVHSLTKPANKYEAPVDPIPPEKKNSIFYMESLSFKRMKARKDSLKFLGSVNIRKCAACPAYGHDLVEAVTVMNAMKNSPKTYAWSKRGYVNCLNASFMDSQPRSHWLFTKALSDIVKTPESCLIDLRDVINRFVFVVPAVTAPRIKLHVSHPHPSKTIAERRWEETMKQELSPRCAFLHPVISNTKTQFPDLRLIQYDCGKLQRLSDLLWELKSGSHRVLIFTQMTRMLDILEQFLNYHGHTYLRLDGATKVEDRQLLMETFNMDKRYFCFILSTRSGGIGINLTGADTVIFYDSDWNPTMDAQAQDRCHRIGQTRDVHIYRLISERTVEENILKKANQKRLLGDLAIEGGNFTTAFFKKNTIHELFGIDVRDDSCRVEDVDKGNDECPTPQPEMQMQENFSPVQLEQALGMAEEELDQQAAKTARAEAAAELAEFDESIPLDSDSRDNEEKSPAEEELDKLMGQLTPVEKYALQFLESIQDPISQEQLKLAKEEIEAQKRDWELEHLKALKEEDERRLNSDEDPLLSYGRSEAYEQVYLSLTGMEEMPIWAPPTPPQDENDLYIDYSIGFMYEQSLMSESQLPPVYVRKESKRLKIDPVVSAVSTSRKQKVRKEDSVYIPRSLFDRPTAAIMKMRREAKLQKFKGIMAGVPKPASFSPLKQQALTPSQQPITINKPTVDTHQDNPEWLVHEDWAILQVIQSLQGLALNLAVVSPAHLPNWDLVADHVNSVSRIYRSARQCKNRYESVIVPREEGKILYDTNPKKQKKTKGIYKTKNNRPMRTSQLYQQDNNASFTNLFSGKFESILAISKHRAPSIKTWFSQSGKNPKHTSVLAESGINYDQPLTPMLVASNRAERISREKQKNHAAAQAAAQVAEQQQLVAKFQQVQQQATVSVAGGAGITPHQAQAVIASFTQAQQLQQTSQLSKSALQAGTVTTVSLAKPLGNGIMVNTAAGSNANTFATISKALGQAGVATMSSQGAAAVQNATVLTSAALRSQRTNAASSGTATTMTVQGMVAASQVRGLATSTVAGNGTTAAPAVVSVAGLAAVQLQAASQRIPASSLATTTVASAITQTGTQVATARNVTPSQLQVIRQTAILRQQRLQEQQLKHQQLKRLQVASAAQQSHQQAATGKVTVNSNSSLSASMAAAQQRAAQHQAAIKQSIGRTMTEADMAQLLKRQQLQQQKQAVTAAQLTTAQILAQAQLQQVQQQQVQAGTVQTPVATLVKTVSAPTSLGGSPSVAIPVAAVTMAGVNINVSLPQGKAGNTPAKGTSSAATVTPQQLRHLQIQHQLLQQRKIQKVTSVAQLTKVTGKNPGGATATLPSPLSTVQIVQHGAQASSNQQGKGIQAAPGGMTVQQIQQVIKQVLPSHVVSNAQVTGGTPVTTAVSQNQILSHHAVLQAAATSVTGMKPSVSVPLAINSSAAIVSTSPSIQSLSSATGSTGASVPIQTRIIPVTQTAAISVSSTSTLASAHTSLKQTIQVVSASPSLTANLQSQANIRGEPNLVSSNIKPQTSTSPSTTLTTSTVLKGSPAVVVSCQQPSTAILQQVASSSSSFVPSQAMTLAVRAAASQAQGQTPVQIQVQQASTLVGSQSQSQIQHLTANPSTINITQAVPMPGGTSVTNVLPTASNVAALTSQMPVDSTLAPSAQVVMQNVAPTSQTGSTIVMPAGLTGTSNAATTAHVVQAAIQAAKQQQQAAQQQQQQQQRASPYTMRLRNLPKQ